MNAFYRDIYEKLRAVDDNPMRLFRWLLEGLNIDNTGNNVSSDDQMRIDTAIERLLAFEPLSKILNEKEFYGRNFKTTGATLDPRFDTEILIQAAKAYFEKDESYHFLDCGTGTGCIIITLLLEFPQARGVAVDLSLDALTVAIENAERLGVSDRVTFLHSDWLNNVTGTFDGIFSNPPYIEQDYPLHPSVALYDPKDALFGGVDGLDAYHLLFKGLHAQCTKDTFLFFEIGFNQGESVPRLAEKYHFTVVEMLQDSQNHPRGVILKS